VGWRQRQAGGDAKLGNGCVRGRQAAGLDLSGARPSAGRIEEKEGPEVKREVSVLQVILVSGSSFLGGQIHRMKRCSRGSNF
jgi:hypothetical protein